MVQLIKTLAVMMYAVTGNVRVDMGRTGIVVFGMNENNQYQVYSSFGYVYYHTHIRNNKRCSKYLG